MPNDKLPPGTVHIQEVKHLMTPAARQLVDADSKLHNETIWEFIKRDRRFYYVPTGLTEGGMKPEQVMAERNELPVIVDGSVLNAFKWVNNSLEGTVRLPLDPEDHIGIQLPVSDITRPLEEIDQLVIRKKPKVVVVKANGKILDRVSLGGDEVSISKSFDDFYLAFVGMDPYSEDFLDAEMRLHTPEGEITRPHGSKEY